MHEDKPRTSSFSISAFQLAIKQQDAKVSLCFAAPENFDEFVNGRKHALVEFYAPWCGHCKRMTGEFKQVRHLACPPGPPPPRMI